LLIFASLDDSLKKEILALYFIKSLIIVTADNPSMKEM